MFLNLIFVFDWLYHKFYLSFGGAGVAEPMCCLRVFSMILLVLQVILLNHLQFHTDKHYSYVIKLILVNFDLSWLLKVSASLGFSFYTQSWYWCVVYIITCEMFHQVFYTLYLRKLLQYPHQPLLWAKMVILTLAMIIILPLLAC